MGPEIMAIAAIVAGGLQGYGSIKSAKADRKTKEKEIEERAKQRRTDLASQRMERKQKAGQDLRQGQRELAQARAQILQGIAQNIKLGGRGG